MSIADLPYCLHNSRTHQPRRASVSRYPKGTTGFRTERTDLLLPAFFFEFGNDRTFWNTKIPAYISHAATVERLNLNLLFYSRTPGVIRVVQLKTLFTAFTAIALRTILTVTVFHKIVFIALRACNFAVLFHVSILTYLLYLYQRLKPTTKFLMIIRPYYPR